MRIRTLPLALLCTVFAALLAAPAHALTVGIAENQPRLFADPLFQQLGSKHARVVVSYNVMRNKADDGPGDELTRVREYLAAAEAAGVTPLVTFEHARGDASRCGRRSNRNKAVCRLPTTKSYESNFKAFRKAFPKVRVYAPWNEWNHFTQPTSRSPQRAARFTDIAAKNCRGCTIVAMDALDQADNVRAKRPTFRKTTADIRAFRRALKTKRNVCGLHIYSDVNRFRDTGTRALMRAMGCRTYWATEVGGLYDFGSFWSASTRKGCRTAEACQLKATKYMFSLARKHKKLTRLYVYNWFGGLTPRFDAGLIDRAGQPRPAYFEVAKHI
jgi:hypothetical protein